MGVRQGRFCDYVPHSGAIASDADVEYQVKRLSEGEPVKDEDGNEVVYEFDSAKCARNWILLDSKGEEEEASSEEGSSDGRRRGRHAQTPEAVENAA